MAYPKRRGLASSFLRAIGLMPKAQDPSGDKMDHTSSCLLPPEDQSTSDFFEKLPGEVRDRIYTFALSSYDDPNQMYDRNTAYWRPDCIAPPKVDCALLQTCQRIYREAWFRPWASLVQKFWLTSYNRRPNHANLLTPYSFSNVLQRVFDSRGRVEINKVQVFPQLYMLEPGSALAQILSLDHLYPLSFTITIRHHDWWYWESDNRLHIKAKWVNQCRFPDSLKSISLELESLQRKKDQIDWMAEMMRNTWHFQTKNLSIFSASKNDTSETLWSGSSTWNDQRWVRDETKPEQVDYYIKTVTWKRDASLSTIEAPAPDLTAPREKFKVIEDSTPNLPTHLLSVAKVPPGVGANEAKRRVLAYSNDDHTDVGLLDDDDMGFGLFDADDYYVTDDDNIRYMVSAGGIVYPARVNGVLRYPTTGAGAILERGEPQELDEDEENVENDGVSEFGSQQPGPANGVEESEVSSLDDGGEAVDTDALEDSTAGEIRQGCEMEIDHRLDDVRPPREIGLW